VIRNDKSLLRVVVFAVATAAASACAPPDTDVVDTSTERVGDDSIVAERDADATVIPRCRKTEDVPVQISRRTRTRSCCARREAWRALPPKRAAMVQAWFVGEHVIDVPSVKASASSQGAEK